MFFFILMLLGIAALTIDMGLVRLSHSLTQNAADTAALEGLRQRDNGDPGDPIARDSNRRIAAKGMVDLAFSDGGNLADPRYVSAGMDFPQDPLADEVNAHQPYDPAAILANPYRPGVNLQSNYQIQGTQVKANCANGDMVAGNPSPNPSPLHTEDSQYIRDDFTPADNGDCTAAGDPLSSSQANQFLVRLRRTTNPGGTYDPLAQDSVPEVSSSGSTLPLLFGRGTLIERTGVNGAHAPRRDGIAIRATAIANVASALQAGPAGYGRLGLTSFAIDKTCWISLLGGVKFTPGPGPGLWNGDVCGVASAHDISTAQVLAIGDPPPYIAGAPLTDGDGYVPIVDAALNQVVGFGYARVATVLGAFTVIPLQNKVASGNASALLHGAVSSPAVLLGNAQVGASTAGSLLAPVLAR